MENEFQKGEFIMRGTVAKRLRNAARKIARPNKQIYDHGGIKYTGYRRVYQDMKRAYMMRLK